MTEPSWVQAENYPTPLDAEIGLANLERAGIEALIFDEETGYIGIYNNAIGGIRLMVRAENLDAARAVLAVDHSSEVAEEAEVPDDEDITGDAPYCSQCHARDLGITAVSLPANASNLHKLWHRWFGAKRTLLCRRCGNTWRQ